jgi:C-terminal processing protease CtpA/Prc
MLSRAAFALLLVLAFGCRTYDPQVFDERLRAATFDDYWEELDEHYPYFALKHIDWNASRERYRGEALAAPTHLEFMKVLGRMLDDLEDVHVNLQSPKSSSYFGHLSDSTQVSCALAVVDRKIYVEWLPGVVGVDSTRVDDHVPTEMPRLVSIDGHDVHRVEFAELLLAGAPGTTSRLGLAWRSRPEEEVLVRRPENLSFSFPIASRAGVALAGDVGYLRLRTLRDDGTTGGRENVLAELDSQIDRLAGTRACVLDLQYDGGGDFDLLVEVLGRFFRTPTVAARGRVHVFWPFSWKGDVTIEPRKNAYDGKVVVLVNAETASAAEWMASILRRERGAILVGERTAGADAGVEDLTGPDGTTLSIGVERLVDPDGNGFQDVGLRPDVAVPLTLESVEEHGYLQAQNLVREERLRRALEILGAEDRIDALRKESENGGGSTWENGRGHGSAPAAP